MQKLLHEHFQIEHDTLQANPVADIPERTERHP